MSLTPNDGESAIWKAAAILPLHASWERVEVILRARDVDIDERSEDAWMHMFNKSRGIVEDIREKSRSHSPPSDTSPVAGVDLSTSQGDSDDMPTAIVVLVGKNEWHPDGIARVWCGLSDKYDGDCMLDTIVEKLGCPIDANDQAILTFTPNCGGKTLTRKFRILPDGEFDVMFRRNPWKEEAMRVRQRHEEGRLDSELGDTDNDLQQQQLAHTDEVESAKRLAAQAMGAYFAGVDARNMSPDQLGNVIATLSLSVTRSFNAQAVPAQVEPLQDRGRRSQPVSPTRRMYTRDAP